YGYHVEGLLDDAYGGRVPVVPGAYAAGGLRGEREALFTKDDLRPCVYYGLYEVVGVLSRVSEYVKREPGRVFLADSGQFRELSDEPSYGFGNTGRRHMLYEARGKPEAAGKLGYLFFHDVLAAVKGFVHCRGDEVLEHLDVAAVNYLGFYLYG